jgi:hypothetical protein
MAHIFGNRTLGVLMLRARKYGLPEFLSSKGG